MTEEQPCHHELVQGNQKTTAHPPPIDSPANAMTPPYQRLPNELLSHIIQQLDEQKYLYECALVNKHFHVIVNPILWYAPRIHTTVAMDRFMICLTIQSPWTLGQHIRTLDLLYARWTDTHLLLMMPHLCFLETLRIGQQTTVTDVSLRHVARHCPHLTSLTLTRVRSFSEKSLMAFAQHCPRLTHVGFIECLQLPANTFTLLTACPLTSVHIALFAAKRLPDMMVRDLTWLDQLRQLKLYGCPAATIESLLIVSPYRPIWPHLMELRLDNCRYINDTMLIPFLQSPHRRHLVHVGLKDGQWTDLALDVLASLPELTSVDLAECHYISSTGVHRLVTQCSTLAKLTVSHCHRVSMYDFPFALSRPATSRCVRLDSHALEAMRCGQ